MNKTQKLKKKIAEYVGLECRVCDGRKMLMSERCHSCDGSGEADITLEDVLIVLEKIDSKESYFTNYDERHGVFFFGQLNPDSINSWKHCSKTKDEMNCYEWKPNTSLENQSEETKQFLFEILCD